MKTTVILSATAALLLVMLLTAMRTKTLVLESVADAQALWDEERLFVVLQKGVAVQRTSWLMRKVSHASGILFPRPRLLPETLMVFALRDGKLERFEYPNVGALGSAFPLGNDLYFQRGSAPADYPCVFHWTEKKVIRIERGEAEKIAEAFQTEDDLLKREGWQKRDLYFTDGQRNYPIQQGHRTMRIVLSKAPQRGTTTIELVNEETNTTNILYAASSRPREIGAEELRTLGTGESK